MNEEELTLEQLADGLLRWKLDSKQRMDEIEETVGCIREELKRHESQRSQSTLEIKKDIAELGKWFQEHDKNEMGKYDDIIKHIQSLKETLVAVRRDTDNHKGILAEKQKQAEIDAKVQEALEAQNAPRKELIKKALMTAISIITAAVVLGTWELVMFLSKINGG